MKRILDVGQCNPDHSALAALARRAGAEVVRVARTQEALQILREEPIDLVFVNRKIDADYSDGTELIQEMQRQGISTPIMLISNYPSAQAEAVQLGALPGFGKNELSSPGVLTRIREALGQD
ncbi:MAG: response regulator [Spirochaetales bacterium]|nr:response regulator [Spirochaetales bacterium]